MKIEITTLDNDQIKEIVGLLEFFNAFEQIDFNAERNIYKTFYHTNFLVKFDWFKWDEGRKLINDIDSINKADLLTLRMLVTTIIRNDRFNEGAFERALENGTVKTILERVKEISLL